VVSSLIQAASRRPNPAAVLEFADVAHERLERRLSAMCGADCVGPTLIKRDNAPKRKVFQGSFATGQLVLLFVTVAWVASHSAASVRRRHRVLRLRGMYGATASVMARCRADRTDPAFLNGAAPQEFTRASPLPRSIRRALTRSGQARPAPLPSLRSSAHHCCNAVACAPASSRANVAVPGRFAACAQRRAPMSAIRSLQTSLVCSERDPQDSRGPGTFPRVFACNRDVGENSLGC